MTAPYRYADKPTVAEALYVSPDETWPINAVADDGLSIDVTDRIGRPWHLTRSPIGCWPVVPVTPPQ